MLEQGDDVNDTLAVMADIHGNTGALEAVLHDIREQGINRAFNLGDILYGPLDPAGTFRTLLSCGLDLVHIKGNGDRMLLEAGNEPSPTVRFTLDQLGPEALAWLRELPEFAMDGELFACHGTPRCDSEYLAERLVPGGIALRPAEELAALLASVTQRLVLCGHSHLPHALRVPDGKLVVNPGSVGLPAYADDEPLPHAMESGSPHARYAALEFRDDGWRVAFHCVAYDHEAAAALALRNGRPDWARALAGGRA